MSDQSEKSSLAAVLVAKDRKRIHADRSEIVLFRCPPNATISRPLAGVSFKRREANVIVRLGNPGYCPQEIRLVLDPIQSCEPPHDKTNEMA